MHIHQDTCVTIKKMLLDILFVILVLWFVVIPMLRGMIWHLVKTALGVLFVSMTFFLLVKSMVLLCTHPLVSTITTIADASGVVADSKLTKTILRLNQEIDESYIYHFGQYASTLVFGKDFDPLIGLYDTCDSIYRAVMFQNQTISNISSSTSTTTDTTTAVMGNNSISYYFNWILRKLQ